MENVNNMEQQLIGFCIMMIGFIILVLSAVADQRSDSESID